MEENNQPNIASNSSPAKKSVNFLSVVLLLVGLVAGIVIGFFVSRGQTADAPVSEQQPPQTNAPTPTPDPRILQDPAEILKNGIFTEWYGALSGVVISKTSNSFTVESGENQLEIFIQPAISRIADVTESPEDPQIITIEQLPLNSTVEGSVTISRGTLTGDLSQKVIANGFSVIQK